MPAYYHGKAACVAALLVACASSPTIRTAQVPVQLTENHVYVPVAIGKHAPSWFLLDTGAQITAFAQTTADALHLAFDAREQVQGAGPAAVKTTVFHDIDLDVGGNAVHVGRMVGLPLTEPSLDEGRRIDGLLGRSAIEQFAIEIDYTRRVLRLTDGSVPPGAVMVPMTFDGGWPVVATELTLADGRTLPMHMVVDTGAGGILVHRPFAVKHHIDAAFAPAIEGPFSIGLGGPSRQRIGRAKRFALAGFTFDAPIIAVSRDPAGTTALAEVDGMIGAEILRRFTVTFDYAHRRLLLVPNAALHDPFEADMSGAGFKAADLKFDRILIRYVLPHSPASEAGLEEGDEVVSVDGNKVTLQQLRALFAEPGKRATLHVRRRHREFDAAIVTRRLV
jgi:hypothetical protein